MNIFKFEFIMYKKSILIWSIAISLSLILYMAFYPPMAADTTLIDDLMQEYPDELLAFMGINPDLSITSLFGYYALTFGMIQIPLAIQASNYGFHMLSVEERELTADFLLSKPVSRKKILISKFLASLTALTIVNAATWVSSFIAIYLFKGDTIVDYSSLVLLLSTITIFQLFFVSIGMVVSVLLRKIESVLSYSMALGFGLYIVYGFKAMFDSTLLGFLTPYAYFNPADILISGKYDFTLTFVSCLITIVSLVMSYFLYLKRNIHSL